MPLAQHPAQDIALPDRRLDDVLFAMGAYMRFTMGEEIFGEGETADLVYQLVRGTVGLRCFAFGRHHELDLLNSPGALFGLDPGPEHETTAEALTDCLVLVASRRGLAVILGEAEVEKLIEPDEVDHDDQPERRPH